MKRLLLALSVTVLSLSSCDGKTGKPEGEGQTPAKFVLSAKASSDLSALGFTVFSQAQRIPAFNLATPDGSTVALSDFAGRYLFLNIWATWCPHCVTELPSMQNLYQTLADDGLAMLAISAGEDPELVRTYLKEYSYDFPTAVDPANKVSSFFAPRGIPTSYIINPEGKAIAGYVGARAWDEAAVISVIRALIKP